MENPFAAIPMLKKEAESREAFSTGAFCERPLALKWKVNVERAYTICGSLAGRFIRGRTESVPGTGDQTCSGAFKKNTQLPWAMIFGSFWCRNVIFFQKYCFFQKKYLTKKKPWCIFFASEQAEEMYIQMIESRKIVAQSPVLTGKQSRKLSLAEVAGAGFLCLFSCSFLPIHCISFTVSLQLRKIQAIVLRALIYNDIEYITQ